MGAHLLFVPRPLQGEDPPADSALTFVARTSALTYAPASRADFPGDRPLRTLRRLQPDELSPKVAGGADRQSLVAALGAFAARKPPAPPRDGDPAPRNLVRMPWREPRVLSAPAAPQKWPSPPDPRDALGTDDGKYPSRASRRLVSASRAAAQAGPPRVSPRTPGSPVEERDRGVGGAVRAGPAPGSRGLGRPMTTAEGPSDLLGEAPSAFSSRCPDSLALS